jgi:beta-lactamase superfamily II metal-dependent hydrolase
MQINRFYKQIAILLLSFVGLHADAQTLEPWEKGNLDIHFITTGRGDCAFMIMPDGTTMLIDAGELNPADARTQSPRTAPLQPDTSQPAYAWIADYIKAVNPSTWIDYAMITHFHDDHFGGMYKGAKRSASGKYYLTGITGVGDRIPIRKMVDRGYPDYNYPVDLRKKIAEDINHEDAELQQLANYINFIESRREMKTERFKTGSKDQFVLLKDAAAYPTFYIRNIMSDGFVWNGADDGVYNHFANTGGMLPDENNAGCGVKVQYGRFSMFFAADLQGIVNYGEPACDDMESAVAPVVGKVDIATMSHHGNRNALNINYIQTLRPRVWIEQVWSSDHPGHEVLNRLNSHAANPYPHDMFATNMLEANKLVIGPALEDSYKSTSGHIVIRVAADGGSYNIFVLDSFRKGQQVKHVFGPYTAGIR